MLRHAALEMFLSDHQTMTIFFILLHHAHTFDIRIYLDIGTGKSRPLINIMAKSQELGREWCVVLVDAYIFTGENCTTAFKGKGKVTPLKN